MRHAVALFAGLAGLFVGSASLAVVNRHSGDLRAAAQVASSWNSDARRYPQPSASELAKLPKRAREMIDAECRGEGGDPFRQHNCYAEAAAWMRREAKEQESPRDLGYLGIALTVAAAVVAVLSRRRRGAAFRASQAP